MFFGCICIKSMVNLMSVGPAYNFRKAQASLITKLIPLIRFSLIAALVYKSKQEQRLLTAKATGRNWPRKEVEKTCETTDHVSTLWLIGADTSFMQ